VDSIVCVDACFTQKRRKNQGKAWIPPMQHPETVFVHPEDVKAMEELVETACPSCPQPKNTEIVSHGSSLPGGDYEPGLHVPSAVLDECNDSFIAADANRVKASTLFFCGYRAYGSVVLS